jgi:hypothetical protein
MKENLDVCLRLLLAMSKIMNSSSVNDKISCVILTRIGLPKIFIFHSCQKSLHCHFIVATNWYKLTQIGTNWNKLA